MNERKKNTIGNRFLDLTAAIFKKTARKYLLLSEKNPPLKWRQVAVHHGHHYEIVARFYINSFKTRLQWTKVQKTFKYNVELTLKLRLFGGGFFQIFALP